jgi:hypothetical protein
MPRMSAMRFAERDGGRLARRSSGSSATDIAAAGGELPRQHIGVGVGQRERRESGARPRQSGWRRCAARRSVRGADRADHHRRPRRARTRSTGPRLRLLHGGAVAAAVASARHRLIDEHDVAAHLVTATLPPRARQDSRSGSPARSMPSSGVPTAHAQRDGDQRLGKRAGDAHFGDAALPGRHGDRTAAECRRSRAPTNSSAPRRQRPGLPRNRPRRGPTSVVSDQAHWRQALLSASAVSRRAGGFLEQGAGRLGRQERRRGEPAASASAAEKQRDIGSVSGIRGSRDALMYTNQPACRATCL